MGRTLYTDQDIKVRATMNRDITGAGTVEIHYEDPDGNTGQWTSTLETALTGIHYYDLPAASNTLAGVWWVQAYVIDSASKTIIGERKRMPVEQSVAA